MHASLHVATVNSAALALDGIGDGPSGEGVVAGADGEPTGELREFAAMGRSSLVRRFFEVAHVDGDAIGDLGSLARNAGVTTLTDLASGAPMDDSEVSRWRTLVDAGDYPARISQFLFGGNREDHEAAAQRVLALRATNGPKMRYGGIKLMLDGSIQGFTARLQAPGYRCGHDHGIWNGSLDSYRAAFAAYHRAGLQIHVHCNGDGATQVFLDTVGAVLAEHPRPGHRHVVTHSQLSTPAQYRRMAEYGVGANIFSNHLWYWGDQHLEQTLGLDRASRMNAAATALRHGVPLALHSDAPVTELAPLATAKHAVTRRAPSGAVIGEQERITLDQAMQAITIGPAFQLGMDHEVGSVEAGKYADLAVLDADPYDFTEEPEGLVDVRVLRTMTGGIDHPVP